MFTKPAFPMVMTTMVMRVKMEMFCRAEWKAR
jgi:hypothetical protein